MKVTFLDFYGLIRMSQIQTLCSKPHGELWSRKPLSLLGHRTPIRMGTLIHCNKSQRCHLQHPKEAQLLLHSHKPRDWMLTRALLSCINAPRVPPPHRASSRGPLRWMKITIPCYGHRAPMVPLRLLCTLQGFDRAPTVPLQLLCALQGFNIRKSGGKCSGQ